MRVVTEGRNSATIPKPASPADLPMTVVVPAYVISEVKTGFQMTAIGMMIWQIETFGINWYDLGYVLLFVAAALTIWSMVVYLRAAWPLMRESS